MTVDFLARIVIIGLASYAVVSIVGAILVAATWRVLAVRASSAPQAIADRLFVLRLTPVAAALCVSVLVMTAFLLFEANRHAEPVGPAVLTCAAAGLLLIARAAARTVRSARAAASLRRQWPLAAARPLDTRDARHIRSETGHCPPETGEVLDSCPVQVVRADTLFPVVALMGVFRPRLIIASGVIDACTPAEMAAVIAHEMAHFESRDNLRRAVIELCPDVLAWSRRPLAMERAWTEATELAADDRAAGDNAARRLDLASALVKVARLAANATVPPLPSSALFRGMPVADRVRRLVEPPDKAAPPLPIGSLACAAVLVIAPLALPRVLPPLHEVVEAAIRFGL